MTRYRFKEVVMEQLLREIIEGQKAYKINKAKPYTFQVSRGKGTKLYLTKRIDLLREQLLNIKKGLQTMKYIELTGKCKTCMGCNLLEITFFRGKNECENYVKANDSGLDLCWKILKGEQLKI